MNESEKMLLTDLLKAGKITPHVRNLIIDKFATCDDPNFDFWINILTINKDLTSLLKELTGPQSIELEKQPWNL